MGTPQNLLIFSAVRCVHLPPPPLSPESKQEWQEPGSAAVLWETLPLGDKMAFLRVPWVDICLWLNPGPKCSSLQNQYLPPLSSSVPKTALWQREQEHRTLRGTRDRVEPECMTPKSTEIWTLEKPPKLDTCKVCLFLNQTTVSTVS